MRDTDARSLAAAEMTGEDGCSPFSLTCSIVRWSPGLKSFKRCRSFKASTGLSSPTCTSAAALAADDADICLSQPEIRQNARSARDSQLCIAKAAC